MDPQVRVQDRLFDAMNGGWFKATQIPADKADNTAPSSRSATWPTPG